MQRIIPYLAYENADAAIAFLRDAFGFEERLRYAMPDGRIGHAELTFAGETLMLASMYENFGESPLRLGSVTSHVHLVVDDVDAHFERATKHGATIIAEPEMAHGMRSYRAMDPEGHRWTITSPELAS